MDDRDAFAWFEDLYAAASRGEATVPWDRHAPSPLLVRWARQQGRAGAGQRALVVGSGLGEDAEYIASLDYATTAFDLSKSAIRAARQRFPDSPVDYQAADLFAAPADWQGAFDFVFESRTVQAMPDPPRAAAIRIIGRFVAPGGTLLVAAFARDDDAPADGPPWPLIRAEIGAFATSGLQLTHITRDTLGASGPETSSWLAEFHRPA